MDGRGAPAQARRGLVARGGAALVVVVAVAIRVATYLDVADSAALHTHAWGQSDMHFFHSWGRDVAAGETISFDYNSNEWAMAEPFTCAETGENVQGFRHLDEGRKSALERRGLIVPHVRSLWMRTWWQEEEGEADVGGDVVA